MMRIKRFSIISRLKLFARRDEFPNNLRKKFEITKEELKKYNKVRIHVIPSDEFKRQYKQSTNQVRIDKMTDKLRNDPGTWFDNGNDTFADTHYLKDYSSKSDGYIMFSKKINNNDRFNYRIYLPEITTNKETGEKTYYQKIVLSTCINHSIDGKNGSYVGGQTGTTWHSPKKSKNRNKNKKKDDLK